MSTSSLSLFPINSTLTKLSFPSVIVPVLSTHNTSTLAKTSVADNCCTNVLYFASLTTDTIKVALVRRTKPSGIIPTIPETAPNTALLHPILLKTICVVVKIIPIGTINHNRIFIILLIDDCNSELIILNFLASSANWDE